MHRPTNIYGSTAPVGAAAVGAAALMLALLAVPSPADAAIYKYKTPAGKILITTEKMPGYTLVEVLSGPTKPSKASPSTSHDSPGTSDGRSSSSNTASKPRSSTSSLAARSGEDGFDDIISEASEAYDVPFGFIKAVIRIESAFQPGVDSHAGAQGLMQLMPATAASLNVTDPHDPRQNIYGGTKFLRILIDRYDGDINLILAAYNAGDAAVARYEGIPYPQTRDYVASVYYWYKVYNRQEDSQ